MTYGTPAIDSAPGEYILATPELGPAIWAQPVRQIIDPVQIRIANELSEVYYRLWRYGQPYQYGDWNVCETLEATRRQFDLLCHLVHLMGELAFHHVNLALGTPVPLKDYWLEDTTIRFRAVIQEGPGVPPVLHPIDGAPLGPESYKERGPELAAGMAMVDTELGQSTRGLRDYFLSVCLAETGFDFTGLF